MKTLFDDELPGPPPLLCSRLIIQKNTEQICYIKPLASSG